MSKRSPEAMKMLISLQHAIRDMAGAAEQVAEIAQDTDASGVAFAVLMLRESLLAYGKAVNDYVAKDEATSF